MSACKRCALVSTGKERWSRILGPTGYPMPYERRWLEKYCSVCGRTVWQAQNGEADRRPAR